MSHSGTVFGSSLVAIMIASFSGCADDPTGPADMSIRFRIFRGGDFETTASHCRSAYRRGHVPDVVPGITIALRPVRSTGMMDTLRGAR